MSEHWRADEARIATLDGLRHKVDLVLRDSVHLDLSTREDRELAQQLRLIVIEAYREGRKSCAVAREIAYEAGYSAAARAAADKAREIVAEARSKMEVLAANLDVVLRDKSS